MPDQNQHQSGSLEKQILLAASGTSEEIAGLVFKRHTKIIDALLMNPALSPEMLIAMIKRGQLNADQMKRVSNHPLWRSDYKIKLQLVMNFSTPRGTALKFVKDLYQDDLALISRNVSVHPAIREYAEKLLKDRLSTMRTGEKIALARTATPNILIILMEDEDLRVIEMGLHNYRLTEPDLLAFISNSGRDPEKLRIIAENRKWSMTHAVLEMLAIHPNIAYGTRRHVMEKIQIPLLITLINAPQLNENHRKLAEFVARKRLSEMPESMQIMMAETPSRALLVELAHSTTFPLCIQRILSNNKMDPEILGIIANNRKITYSVDIIRKHPRWKNNRGLDVLLERIAPRAQRIDDSGDIPADAESDSGDQTDE